VIESMKSPFAGWAIAKSVLKDGKILDKISFFKKSSNLVSYCYLFLETEQTANQARDVW
jgi:hypothetical protein